MAPQTRRRRRTARRCPIDNRTPSAGRGRTQSSTGRPSQLTTTKSADIVTNANRRRVGSEDRAGRFASAYSGRRSGKGGRGRLGRPGEPETPAHMPSQQRPTTRAPQHQDRSCLQHAATVRRKAIRAPERAGERRPATGETRSRRPEAERAHHAGIGCSNLTWCARNASHRSGGVPDHDRRDRSGSARRRPPQPSVEHLVFQREIAVGKADRRAGTFRIGMRRCRASDRWRRWPRLPAGIREIRRNIRPRSSSSILRPGEWRRPDAIVSPFQDRAAAAGASPAPARNRSR